MVYLPGVAQFYWNLTLATFKMQKELPQVSLWVFTEQLNYQITFGGYIAMKLLL